MSENRRHIARAFGAALRAARQAQGVSQDELAERCDIDRTFPSLLERGKRGPTFEMLLRLADKLEIPPERLVTDTVARLRAGDDVVGPEARASVRSPSRIRRKK